MDIVLAIGNPYGLGQSVSMGIISATGREYENPYSNYLQTDASINKGNSGGALIDINGRLVNTVKQNNNNGTLTLTNLNNLDTALYFVKITNEITGSSITKKVVKNYFIFT